MSVLVVGEALVDVLDGRPRPGGSPMNVAVGLARLGVPTTLHTCLGRDHSGQLVRRHLRASGVEVTKQSWGTSPTSVAEVTLDDAGAATYRFDITWDPTRPSIQTGKYSAVHVGSISAMMRPGDSVVDAVIESYRPSAVITYDVNVRPALMGSAAAARKRAEAIVARADIVKASDEDVAWLYPELATDQVLARWLALGPKLAVLTAGDKGATAATASISTDVTAPVVRVRDAVGAGDSFMAGLLAAFDAAGLLNASARHRLSTLDSDELRRFIGVGVRCAATTVTREGADPPWRAELGERLFE